VPSSILDLSDVALATGELFNSYNAELPSQVAYPSGDHYHYTPETIVNDGGICSEWANAGSAGAASLVPNVNPATVIDGPAGYSALRGLNFQVTLPITLSTNKEIIIVYRTSGVGSIIAKLRRSATGDIFYLFQEAANSVKAYTFIGATEESIASPQEFVLNEWNIVVIRVDASNLGISINGSEENYINALMPVGAWDQFIVDPSAVCDIVEIGISTVVGAFPFGITSRENTYISNLLQKYLLGSQIPITFNSDASWLDND
jgi:hypothetical protein